MIFMTEKKKKKPENPTDDGMTSEKRLRVCAAAGVFGIITNLLLAVVKFAVGSLSGSVSVTADAANNLTDCASSVVTLVGFRLAGKPADKEHPFGHARYEYLTGLCVSAFVLMLGFSFLKESIACLINRSESSFSPTALILLFASVAVKIFQGLVYRRTGKRTHSVSLSASAADSFNDSIITATVLAGALVRHFTGAEVDGWVGIAVAVVILISGGKLVAESAGILLGKAPDRETVDRLCDTVASYDGVVGMHDLIMHSYGEGRIFASVHVEVDAKKDIMLSHELIDRIEHDVCKKLGIQLVIHLDPITVDDPLTNKMREDTGKIIAGISGSLRFHDFRIVPGKERTNVLFDLVVPTGFVLPDGELVSLVTREINELYPTAVVKIDIDRDYSDLIGENEK